MAYEETLHPVLGKVADNIDNVMVGKKDIAVLSLTAILANGHVLLEDVPGVGKTMMVRTLAKSTGAEFKRIQFTPDLLPSDVTGVSIYNPKTLEFEYRSGPIMGEIVLADEINRTSPKTQSALLEAMEEGSVTVDGVTMPLSKPFLSWLPKTRWNTKERIRCLRPSLTASYSSFEWAIRRSPKRFRCWTFRKKAVRLKRLSR